MIVLAWLLQPAENTPSGLNTTEGIVAVASPGAARDYLPVQDEDGDGIPDWQEALQRTDPVTIEPITEDYNPPDTLTDEFAREFFTDMVRSRNYGEFGVDNQELVASAVAGFQEEARDELITPDQITILNNNSPEFIRSYVNALANIALSYQIDEDDKNPAEILKLAFDRNDPAVLEELDWYIESYDDVLFRSIALEVPGDYAIAHLDYLNALNAVINDLKAMRNAFSDPLKSLIRMKRFEEDVLAMQITVIHLQQKVMGDGVEFRSTDPIWRILSP